MDSFLHTIPSRNLHSAGRAGIRLIVTATVCLFVAIVALLNILLVAPAPRALPPGVSMKEYLRAERSLRQSQSLIEPDDVFFELGKIAEKEGRLQLALSGYDAISPDHPRYDWESTLAVARLAYRLQRAMQAEEAYLKLLELSANRSEIPLEEIVHAHEILIYLYAVELRFGDRQRVLDSLAKLRPLELHEIKQRHFPHLLLWHSGTGLGRLKGFLANEPDASWLLWAWGRYLTTDGELDSAKQVLDRLVEDDPSLHNKAALLENQFERNDWGGFAETFVSIPPFDLGEPRLLTYFRGRYSMQQQDWLAAETFFQTILASDPAHPAAWQGLAKVYEKQQRPAERQEALNRSLALSELRVAIPKLSEHDSSAIPELLTLCEQAGLKEAWLALDDYRRRKTTSPNTR